MTIPDEQIKESKERWTKIYDRAASEIDLLQGKIKLLGVQKNRAYAEICNCSKEWKKLTLAIVNYVKYPANTNK